MFTKIMVPIDLAHADALSRARKAAAGMAQQYDAEIVYAGVTAPTPGPVAHGPAEYAQKLDAFAAAEGAAEGVRTAGHALTVQDPTIDLNDTLLTAAKDIGADMIVMGTHVPGLADRFWASHGGAIAAHAPVSVFLVRG